ncbi:hypothetical protein ACHAWF_011928 [Thalassiosira exigua]
MSGVLRRHLEKERGGQIGGNGGAFAVAQPARHAHAAVMRLPLRPPLVPLLLAFVAIVPPAESFGSTPRPGHAGGPRRAVGGPVRTRTVVDAAAPQSSAPAPEPEPPAPGPHLGRRSALSRFLSVSTAAAGGGVWGEGGRADALPFPLPGGGSDRRQLELCLATILRAEYWATNVARSIEVRLLDPPSAVGSEGAPPAPAPEMSEAQRKQPYLEARLGAKALLTQKVGGGANSRVRDLAGLQLRECLEDAEYRCGELARAGLLPGAPSSKEAKRICSVDFASASNDLVESLASIVEFDGLETTIDPSPRSSLMLSMYDRRKGTFVYRTLIERVVPCCERCLRPFGRERRRLVEEYVRRDHGDEVPLEVLERIYGDGGSL